MLKDIVIIVGGIIGCSIARELSKYNLSIALIEKLVELKNKTEVLGVSNISIIPREELVKLEKNVYDLFMQKHQVLLIHLKLQ